MKRLFDIIIIACGICLFSLCTAAGAEEVHAYPLDLRSAFNMGFADDVSGDCVGGWSDQGSDNDLSILPIGTQIWGGVPFDIVDPDLNDGRSCLVMKQMNRPYFPERGGADQTPPYVHGSFLHLIHALCWPSGGTLGKVVLTYNDGSTSDVIVTGNDVGNWWEPTPKENGDLVWTGMNGIAGIGLFRSIYPIEDKPIKRIDFISECKSVWGVIAATVTREEIPREKRLPFRLAPNDEWKEFIYRKDIEPDSVLDFSSTLDAPAGKYGPVIAKNGHLYFRDRPDKPVRFYGTNLCSGAMYISHDWAVRLADRLASFGFNAIRMHHHDNGMSNRQNTAFQDPERMDEWDFLVSELEKRGIYVTLDIYVSRQVAKDEIPDLPFPIKSMEEYKALVYVNDAVLDNWKTYARNLLTHVNPYTGKSIIEDPAYFAINLVNEGSIVMLSHLTPEVERLYQEKYMEWLQEKGLERPEDKAVAESLYSDFIYEWYVGRFNEMKNFLRGLGVTCLLCDQNNGSTPHLAIMRNHYDYVDCHGYWNHPVFPEGGWKLPAEFSQQSALCRSAFFPYQLSPVRQLDKPFFVSEFDFCRPNRFRSEGPVLISSFGALQGWDALFQFAFSHGSENIQDDTRTRHFMDISTDPIKHLAHRLGPAIFLHSDAKPAPKTIAIVFSPDKPPLPSTAFPAICGKISRIYGVGTIAADKPIPPSTVAVVDLDGSYHGDDAVPVLKADSHLEKALRENGFLTTKEYNPETGLAISTTGQPQINIKKETLAFASDICEALICHEGMAMKAECLSVSLLKSRATVALLSRDGRPLTESRRMLLLHLTDSEPTGMLFADNTMKRMETWGETPYLAERGIARISVKVPQGNYRLYAVALNGRRMSEVPFEQDLDESMITFTAETTAYDEPAFAYELIAD